MRGQAKKDYGPCTKCGERPATGIWPDDGGSLAYTHGAYPHWCEVCILQVQIINCRQAAARLPSLEAKLQALRLKDQP